MRRWIWISLASFLGLTAAAALLAKPLAEHKVRSLAEARGLNLVMEEFALGFMSAELTGVELTLNNVPGINVSLDSVHVELSLTSPSLRSVAIDGGRVQIEGSASELQKNLSAWMAKRKEGAKEARGGNARRVERVRRLDITWKDAFKAGDTQSVIGLQIERGPAGQRVGADLVELTLGNLKAQIAGAEAQSKSVGFDLASAEKIGASEVRLTWIAEEEALEKKADSAPDDSPSAGNLSDRLERDETRVAKLLAGLALIREGVIPRLPRSAEVQRLWLSYERGKEKLLVGPSLLSLQKHPDHVRIAVAPRSNAKGTPLELTLIVNDAKAKEAASLHLKGGPVALSTLGVTEGAFGLSEVAATQLSGTFEAQLSGDVKKVSAGGAAVFEGLAIDSERLASTLVTFPKIAVRGKGEMAVDGSLYRLSDAEISLGKTRFIGNFEMQRDDDHVSLQANAEAPLVSCQALLDSAPRGVLGEAERMTFDGTFSLKAGVEADTRRLSDMKVRWDFKNGCRITAVPPKLDPSQFRGLFRREVMGEGNLPIELEFGPLSSNWVPFDQVTPFIEKALLVTEDGRFFRHDGFDNRAIESAIRDNTRAGSFVRGASTISMQLAKNLYLSRNKTLSRKFQEAALTSLLEQSFEKKELLELYVNVVEFGPGIYGIRQAAEHYFATVPERLTASQAFFLASILPAPTRAHFEADGKLKAHHKQHIHRLLNTSAQREGGLTPEQLELALKEELVFGQADTSPQEATTDEEALDGSVGNDKFPSDPPEFEREASDPPSGKHAPEPEEELIFPAVKKESSPTPIPPKAPKAP